MDTDTDSLERLMTQRAHGVETHRTRREWHALIARCEDGGRLDELLGILTARDLAHLSVPSSDHDTVDLPDALRAAGGRLLRAHPDAVPLVLGSAQRLAPALRAAVAPDVAWLLWARGENPHTNAALLQVLGPETLTEHDLRALLAVMPDHLPGQHAWDWDAALHAPVARAHVVAELAARAAAAPTEGVHWRRSLLHRRDLTPRERADLVGSSAELIRHAHVDTETLDCVLDDARARSGALPIGLLYAPNVGRDLRTRAYAQGPWTVDRDHLHLALRETYGASWRVVAPDAEQWAVERGHVPGPASA